jgi:hypothetical protein
MTNRRETSSSEIHCPAGTVTGGLSRFLRGLQRRTLIVVATGAIAAVGLGGGAAFGYFTSTGTGSAQATVANGDQNVTIATNATAGASLLPGGTGDLVISATNPNPSPVQITALSISGVTGCSDPQVSLVSPSNSYLPVTIPAHASSQHIDIAGALQMTTSSSNDCQGKTLTVNLASVAVQQ